MEQPELAIFQLFKRAIALKELPRTGAIIEGATRSEADTIAAHSWAVSLLSILVATHLSNDINKIDPGKVAEMAVLHDLTECVTGDIPAGLKRDLKRLAPEVLTALEPRVAKFLLSGLVGNGQLIEILTEYEAGASAPAKIVKFADIIDAWAHLRMRLDREFPAYLESSEARLREGSPAQDFGVGNRLADWLQKCREEWADINPLPLSKLADY